MKKIKKRNLIENVKTFKVVYDVYVKFIDDEKNYMYLTYSFCDGLQPQLSVNRTSDGQTDSFTVDSSFYMRM